MTTTTKSHAFKIEYIQPFVDSLRTLFTEHLGGSITVHKPVLNEKGNPTFEVSGVIGFTGKVEGRVLLSLPCEVAGKIVCSLLGLDELPEGVLEDGIGEIANIIVGRAKSDMEQYQIVISPPMVVRGTDYQIAPHKGAACISLPCDTDFGSVRVEISMMEKSD